MFCSFKTEKNKKTDLKGDSYISVCAYFNDIKNRQLTKPNIMKQADIIQKVLYTACKLLT